MEHDNDQCLLKLAVLINLTKLTDTKGRDISSHFFLETYLFPTVGFHFQIRFSEP